MDTSKQRPKHIFTSDISITILLLLIVTPWLHCKGDDFNIEDIVCSCSGTSALCTGTSEDEEEIQTLLTQLLQKCSAVNNLLDLTLKIDKLQTLPSKPFKSFELQHLTLGFGLLSLSDDSFYGLNSSLLSLKLPHNDIEFFIREHSPFSILENLKELNLDYNEISTFHEKTFEDLINLEVLSISGNNLVGLHTNFLENMTAIQTLILDHNKNIISFSDINITSTSLINLSAKNCSINGSLESDSLFGVISLKYVDLSSNNLTRVNAYALDRLHYLETLNLSYNQIETLKNFSFSSLYSLVELDLKGNGIKEIEVFSFANLTKLKILNVAENGMQAIFEKYTADLHSLEKINLENNQIHIIEPGSFSASVQLKELLLQGNAFYCDDCGLMYIVGFLNNDTLFKKEDADAIKCALPEEMRDRPLTEVSPESLDEICEADDSTSETPITIVSTTEKTTITVDLTQASIEGSGEMDTSSVIPITTPQNASESVDAIYESTMSSIPSTTKTSQIIPGSTDTDTTETKLSFESTTEINEVESTPFSTDATTESETTEKTDINTTTEVSTIPVSSHTTAENKEASAQNTSEITTLFTTERINETTISINKFVSLPAIDKTEETTISVNTSFSTEHTTALTDKTELNVEETSHFSSERSTQANFTSTNMLYYNVSTKEFTTTALPAKKVSDSQMIRIIDYSVLDDEICIRWDIKWEILSKQWVINDLKCGVEIQSLRGKQVEYFKNCPTSEHEIRECAIIENKYLDSMYKFCLNVYISLKKLKSCSKYEAPSTTEKPKLSSPSAELPITKDLLPTQEKFIPFKVIKFDATFNYSKSFVDVYWLVNRNERNSICSLNLILMSHSFNYTEAVFSCKNNSYKIQNIKHETFQVCLRNFYQGYYAPLQCKSAEPVSYEFKASTMKDDGYKHSALIAVICLLILIVLIVIVIFLKKLLKKRGESEMYNVSAEEKNVLRRQTSAAYDREPCVRYSYTLKEQMEI